MLVVHNIPTRQWEDPFFCTLCGELTSEHVDELQNMLVLQIGVINGATPIAGWFRRETRIKMDDLGVPLRLRKPPYSSM